MGKEGELSTLVGLKLWAPPPRRHEDFQSSCWGGTMWHYRSLSVFIRAFDGGFRAWFYRFEHI